METCPHEVFLKARHVTDTANINKGHLNKIKLVSDALLSTPQTQIFRSKTDPSRGTSSNVFLCSGVKNGVGWA